MFTRILLAVDASPQADKAVELAGKVAAAAGDEVVVLHVVERHLIQRGGALATISPEGATELVERGAARLRELGAKARPEVGHALEGDTGRVIADTAAELGAGLIVMGSHARGDLGALLLGSVAHKVLHQATCPVLIAR